MYSFELLHLVITSDYEMDAMIIFESYPLSLTGVLMK
jgi:hypothetical protein